MKWLVLTAVLLLAIITGISFFVRSRHGKTELSTSQGQTKVVTIPVEGMSCLACTARVKSTLKAINGVTEVEVNLAGRVARVAYLEGKVSPEQLVSAINRLGYRAGPPRAEETK
jgi:copper chaperone CopZ